MSCHDDHRVRAASRTRLGSFDESRMTLTFDFDCDDAECDGCDNTHEHTLPARLEVCGTCDGKGSHVNPSIDSHGITGEEWARDWDDESREAYMSGRYDVQCYECAGKRVAPEIDTRNLSEAQKEVLKRIQRIERDNAHYDAISRAERAMGA